MLNGNLSYNFEDFSETHSDGSEIHLTEEHKNVIRESCNAAILEGAKKILTEGYIAVELFANGTIEATGEDIDFQLRGWLEVSSNE